MTRDDIIRLADKAGMMPFAMTPRHQSQLAKQLERFAALVAAAEREACAKLIEHLPTKQNFYVRHLCAAAIRKRGEVKP